MNQSEKMKEYDDELALTLERLTGGSYPTARPILHALMASAREGHLCLPLSELETRYGISQSSIVNGKEELFPSMIVDRIGEERGSAKPVILWNGALYLNKNWMRQTSIQAHLTRLLQGNHSEEGKTTHDGCMNEEQFYAYQYALTHQFSLITGGPGCGKSYVAQKIIRAFFSDNKLEKRVVVAAPTGKAVYNLKKALIDLNEYDIRFSTLHSLLKIGSSQGPHRHVEADMVIVDECSMIDVRVFQALLSSIHKKTRLVLIGDPDQLPPVESGTVFADLCKILRGSRCHLKECHRIETASLLRIARAAIELERNEAKRVIMEEQSEAYHFGSLEAFDNDALQNIYRQIYAENHGENWDRWEAAFNAHKILCSHNLGRFGSQILNERLQEMVEDEGQPEQQVFPVILTKNLPKRGLMNGSQGLLIRKPIEETEYLVFQVDGEYRTFSTALVPYFTLGYALSIHKSQGSEYREVSLLLSHEFALFGRESIYTGITRCREKLSIYCEEEALQTILSQTSLRFSGLHAV